MNMVREQGVRQQCAEDEAAIRGFARDDLKDRGGADLYADVSGHVRGDYKVARHEVESTVAAFVKDYLTLAI
jgi:hypothetical protein